MTPVRVMSLLHQPINRDVTPYRVIFLLYTLHSLWMGFWKKNHNYTLRTTRLLGVYWFPSVRRSICPSCIPCLLCSAYSSGWIHFIFIRLIKQLQKVYSKFVCKFLGSILVSVGPSIHHACRVRSVAPTVLVGSVSYSYILSNNFRMCVASWYVSFLLNCKIRLFGSFFKFVTLSCFDLGSDVNHWYG